MANLSIEEKARKFDEFEAALSSDKAGFIKFLADTPTDSASVNIALPDIKNLDDYDPEIQQLITGVAQMRDVIQAQNAQIQALGGTVGKVANSQATEATLADIAQHAGVSVTAEQLAAIQKNTKIEDPLRAVLAAKAAGPQFLEDLPLSPGGDQSRKHFIAFRDTPSEAIAKAQDEGYEIVDRTSQDRPAEVTVVP